MVAGSLFLSAAPALAQGMMWGGRYGQFDQQYVQDGVLADNGETAADEAAGKAILDKLTSKQLTCAQLTDDDFDLLGDYYMGLRTGDAHASMNAAMKSRFGEDGERQMHITMGKRFSDCDAAAAYPTASSGFRSMMSGSFGGGMMGWSDGVVGYGPPSSFGGWFFLSHFVTMALVWILLALGIVALVKWLAKKDK